MRMCMVMRSISTARRPASALYWSLYLCQDSIRLTPVLLTFLEGAALSKVSIPAQRQSAERSLVSRALNSGRTLRNKLLYWPTWMIPVPPEVVLKRRPAGWQKQERVVEDGRIINAVGSRLEEAEGYRRGEYLLSGM